jgi:iron complex transport system substrate-binding protein
MHPPARIVCLTEETTETLYLLGEQNRIVGISGYTVRPPQARKEKPRVSAFITADLPKILALEPDLVLTFSDLQADIAAALIRAGISVYAFNQRTVAEILDMIRMVGALVGADERASALVDRLAGNLETTRRRAVERHGRPRVYFEEWDDPMISGIAWVSELIGIAGGADIFPELAACKAAKDRIVTTEEVICRAPDIVVGSWCGKKFNRDKVVSRPGFAAIPAIRSGQVHEIKSALILQPGPAALTDGLAALEAIISGAAPAVL